MKKLIIVGRIGTDENGRKRGEMARVMVDECVRANIPHKLVKEPPFEPVHPSDRMDDHIVVYVSSRGRFQSVLDACRKQNLPLIVASSGIKVEDVPANITVPVILTPNLGLLIQALFDVLPRFASLTAMLSPRNVVIAEGHQSSKTSAPITAQNIADMFGVTHENIGHIRNDAVAQAVLDVPEGEVGGFGTHFIKVTACGVEVKLQFKVIGRQAYFFGLRVILEKIEELGPNLKPSVYEGHRLVFS